MTDETTTQSQAMWPISNFSFQVKWGDKYLAFQEVSGLASESQILDYRTANNSTFSTVKMTRMAKMSNIMLKRGGFPYDNPTWDWLTKFKMTRRHPREPYNLFAE